MNNILASKFNNSDNNNNNNNNDDNTEIPEATVQTRS